MVGEAEDMDVVGEEEAMGKVRVGTGFFILIFNYFNYY